MDRVTLTAGGVARQYLLFTPAAGRPLVVLLHGAGGTAAWADGEVGWSQLAARAGFALALPEGLPPDRAAPPSFLTNPQRWNDGSPGPTGEPSAADDVGFLDAVVGDAASRAGANPGRVCVAGFSNGAGMAFRYAAERADRVAAVAPVAGHLWLPDPRPARPVPTLYVVGTADPLVPLRGGDTRSPWRNRLVRRPAVADTLERWAAAVGCGPVPRPVSDAGGVRVEEYPGPVECRAVYVDGLGHHWPGGKGQLNPRLAGPPSGRFDGNAAVWDFFRRQTDRLP